MTDYLITEELSKLIDSIDSSRDKLLVRFLYESGCAVSEVSTLKASDVKPDGTINFQGRTSTISSTLAHELLKQADEYIFHTRQTPTITPKRIQQIIKPYLKALHKTKTSPHLLRYTHIIHAYEQGATLAAISTQTGLTAVRLAQILADLRTKSDKHGYHLTATRGGAE